VVEIKTELADSQQLLGSLDVKVRLSPVLARELHLPPPAHMVPILVFEESMTTRRRVRALASLFERFELRGREARAWLRQPSGAPNGLLIFSAANPSRTRQGSGQRVRLRRSSDLTAERG
jgi:hypothetical protein